MMNGLSARTKDLAASPIREILSVIDKPGMISFAGGLPAPGSFPELSAGDIPAGVLQYGCSEGEWMLRKQVQKELAAMDLSCDVEQILILSGSQQGIDLTAKLFLDKGTPAAVEAPTYLAALQVFRYFGARLAGFPPGRFTAVGQTPRLVYTIPTFQNPTGYCYSRAERECLAAACDRHGITLFEDDPYRELYYDTCCRVPVCSLLKNTSWVYQGSFSKTFAPGLRLGFLVCSRDLLPYYVRLKQAADLHSCRLSQWLVLRLLAAAGREHRLGQLRARYKTRRDRFHHCLQEHMGELCRWTPPAGGLFFWLRLNRALDTDRLLQKAIENNVAFMPGRHFYPSPQKAGFLRLNFSHAGDRETEEGIRILSALIRQANEGAAYSDSSVSSSASVCTA